MKGNSISVYTLLYFECTFPPGAASGLSGEFEERERSLLVSVVAVMASFETLRERLEHLAIPAADGGLGRQPHSLGSYGKTKVLEEVCGLLEPLELRSHWDVDDLAASLGRGVADDYESYSVEFGGKLGVALAPFRGAAVVAEVGEDCERSSEVRSGDFLVGIGDQSVAGISARPGSL